jgi:hypothetical protein
MLLYMLLDFRLFKSKFVTSKLETGFRNVPLGRILSLLRICHPFPRPKKLEKLPVNALEIGAQING